MYIVISTTFFWKGSRNIYTQLQKNATPVLVLVR
uniref:Uncharacterized protein n=1 Tax=Anguilla anguilla TaxID=7936 RepID=A0A0E9Q7W1_ANGAN